MPDVLAAALGLQDKDAEAQDELRDLLPIAWSFAKEAPTEIDYNKPQGVRFFHAEILLIAGRRNRDNLLAVKKLTGPLNQFHRSARREEADSSVAEPDRLLLSRRNTAQLSSMALIS